MEVLLILEVMDEDLKIDVQAEEDLLDNRGIGVLFEEPWMCIEGVNVCMDGHWRILGGYLMVGIGESVVMFALARVFVHSLA